MRLVIALTLCALALVPALPAAAQFGDVVVYDTFVVDPNIGGGGYNEVTVVNGGVSDVYAVIIANDLSEVIYTAPALAGQWQPTISRRIDWEIGGAFPTLPYYSAPNTAVLSWDLYVGSSYNRVLTWCSANTTTKPKIAPGEALIGLRYLPIGGSRAYGARREAAPFTVFDGAGTVVASGVTVPEAPVATEGTSFSRVKSLYR